MKNNLNLLNDIIKNEFVGPKTLEIDITNRCNHKCIFCWFHSPILKKQRPKNWEKQKMELDLFKEIVKETKKKDADEVIISAQGEPFLNPDIMKMIEYVKSKGLYLKVYTNGSLLKQNIKKVSKLVDYLSVDVSAATPKMYAKIHSASPRVFHEVKQNLEYLNELKKKGNKTYLRITNIITKINYKEIPLMATFASEVEADFLSFKPINVSNIVSSETKQLLLDKSDAIWIKKQEKKLLEYMKIKNLDNNLELRMKNLFTDGNYTEKIVKRTGCYSFWTHWLVFFNGSISPCCHAAEIFHTNGKIDFEQASNSTEFKRFLEKIKTMNSTGKIAYEKCKMCENFEKNLEIYEELKRHKLLKLMK
jgi:MoaA/NifB/PqqE/SkfB family radical SAM enzyme